MTGPIIRKKLLFHIAIPKIVCDVSDRLYECERGWRNVTRKCCQGQRVTKGIVLFATLVAALLVAGCAPKANEGTGETEDQEDAITVAFTWSETSDCGICHGVETGSFEDSSCLASLHAFGAENCMCCHEDAGSLKSAHADVDASDTNPKASVNAATCLVEGCHVQADLASLVGEQSFIRDSQGTAVNPHDLPAGESHNAITCAECHTVHEAKGAQDEARKTCLSCHHQDVFECGTCHAE